MIKSGYQVSVLAVAYMNLPKKELVDGVEVERLLLKIPKYLGYRPGKANPFQLFFIYSEMLLRYIAALMKRYKDCSIIHCNDIQALPLGVFFKIFINKNAKILYDCHEYETEKFSNKKLIKLVVKILERNLIGFSDSVITVSGSIACAYSQLYDISKPEVILNCPPKYNSTEKKNNVFRNIFKIRENQNIFIYIGGFFPGRGIELLIETFQSMKTDNNVIIFMGQGPLQQAIEHAQTMTENIFFHAAVEPDQILDYIVSADYGFALIQDVSLSYRYCLPNKLFEYIQVGLPVLASNLTEMRKLVLKYGVGEIIEDNTCGAVMKAVNEITKKDASHYKKGLETAAQMYNWENQEKVLLKLYSTLHESHQI